MAPRAKTEPSPTEQTRPRRRGQTCREQVLPLVALRETVIFPEMIVPLQVGRDKSVQALNQAVADSSPIALVTQRQADREDITDPAELYAVGTLAKIAQVVQLQDGTVRAIVQGQQRAAAARASSAIEPYILARIEVVDRAAGQGPRGPGAGAHRPGPDRAVRPVGRAGAAGGGRRRPQHHRARAARRHGRLQPGHDHRAAPGAARDDRRHRAAEARLELPRPPDRDPRAEGQDPVRGQVRDGQDPARVHPARAAEGHPARAGRGRPAAGRDQRAAREGRAGGHARGDQGAGDQGGRPHEPDPVRLARGRRHPDLRRLARRPALERRPPTTTWTSRRPRRSSTRTTTAWRRSRSASSSTSRCARWRTRSAAPSWRSSARQAWARRRSARASRGPWAASSCA